jgi:hypothetical protein
MEPVVCLNCYEFFPPSPRHKNQRYCMKPPCRRAKKAAWKRHKMATDPDFKLDQKLSNQKWAQNTPGYWKDYRERNPQKAERNRILQSVRNRRRAKQGKSDRKVDASVIAKVDALKVNKGRRVLIFSKYQNLTADCKERLVRWSSCVVLIWG